MKLALRILATFSFMAGVAGAGFFYLDSKGFFNASELVVSISNFEKHKSFYEPLIKELQVEMQGYSQTPIWKVNLAEISKKISTRAWVHEVSVTRFWPDKILATVSAKEIRFLLMTQGGAFKPILDDGSLLSTVNLKGAPNVPILRGRQFEKDSVSRSRAVEILKQIPETGTFSQNTISEMYFSSKEGYWARMIQDGIRVKLGQEQIPLKVGRVSQVMDYMSAHEIKAAVIDADLSRKVLVKPIAR